MSEALVPIFMFAAIPLTVWAVSAYRHKTHKATLDVMSTMVDKGEALTPEVVRALGIRPRRKHNDLRVGLILIAIAIATIFMGGAIPEKEAQHVMGGIAAFPFMVGLVYTGLWVFIGRKSPQD